MCCRCSNPSGACYHVGPCSLCAFHAGYTYVGDPLQPISPTVPAPLVPYPAPVQPGPSFPSVQLITPELDLLREILKTLVEIKALLEQT